MPVSLLSIVMVIHWSSFLNIYLHAELITVLLKTSPAAKVSTGLRMGAVYWSAVFGHPTQRLQY